MKDCVFCKIVRGEIKEDYLHEDEKVIVYRDIHPRTDIHLLTTTKTHYNDFSEMMDKKPELLTHIGNVVEITAEKVRLKGKAYTWGFHSGGKQSVPHTHAQLLSVEGDELVL